jgi:hypothetical protein
MLNRLNWKPLQERRLNIRLCLFYKIVNRLVEVPTENYLVPQLRPSQHYNSMAYTIFSTRHDYYKYSFFPRTVIAWNQLPDMTVKASTLEAFKTQIHAYMSKCFILHLLYKMHSFGFSCKYFVNRHHQHLCMTKSIEYSLLSLTTISKKKIIRLKYLVETTRFNLPTLPSSLFFFYINQCNFVWLKCHFIIVNFSLMNIVFYFSH